MSVDLMVNTHVHQVTRFCVVRYGNVLGSRGSVVPVWLDKLRSGAQALPVTHAGMTRFWLTLEQVRTPIVKMLPSCAMHGETPRVTHLCGGRL